MVLRTLMRHSIENSILIDGLEHDTSDQEDRNNNKMKRMNGEVRDREKTMRSLKNVDTPILKGLQIYHNYMRPHESLDGETPAE